MIALFETDHKNIKRYYLIHNELKKQFDANNVLVLFDSFKEKYNFSTRSKNQSDHLYNLNKHIDNIDVLIINGNRIPDIYISAIAKNRGIPIIYIQHGPHSHRRPRQLKFYMSNFLKVISHLLILGKISLELKSFSLFYKTVLIQFFTGGTRISHLTKSYSPNISYVFSEYYKKWHEKYYFGHLTKYKLIRNKDSLLKKVFLKNHLIFCHQTLVEDGRLEFKIFKQHLESVKLFGENNNLELCVKTHPRISYKLKKYYKKNGWLIHEDPETIPIGSVTIGFYSSLLSFWVFNKIPVISINLPTEHDVPNEIYEYCTLTDLNKIKELKLNMIIADLDTNKLSKKADYFFNFTGTQELKVKHITSLNEY